MKIAKFFAWLDENILLLLAGFLLAFIPLYPKLPLFEAIPGYIVRVRLEDVFLFIAILIWVFQTVRKKIKWKTPFLSLMGVYAIVGILSLISAVFLIQTIPLETIHVAKSALHYFRYLEYFSLFLIVFSSIKSGKQIKILVFTLLTTLITITLYGYGQKYWYWPVYSTMNREFSKGLTLYLTEHARVQSTFGGHYDFAAFLVILLPISLALAYKSNKKAHRVLYHIIHVFGLWSLIVSASRTSFAAYLLGALTVIIFLSWKNSTWQKKLSSFFSKSFLFGIIVSVMMVLFGADLQERLLQVLEGYPQLWNTYHQLNDERKRISKWILVTTGLKEPEKPVNSISLDEAMDMEKVLVNSDERPSTDRPSDVYVDVPDKVRVATKSATGEDIFIDVEQDRTWSANAQKYGLSLGIRLDTLWPQAIAGFLKNPLLGSGYATLNKVGPTQFTEAESTDNNFLRTLGETGILGFLTFYGLVILAIKIAFQQTKNKDFFISALAIGFIGSSVGLLANATYIDVFAASKVAFTYWGITGIIAASFFLKKKESFTFSPFDLDKKEKTSQNTKKQKNSTKKFKNI